MVDTEGCNLGFPGLSSCHSPVGGGHACKTGETDRCLWQQSSQEEEGMHSEKR